MLRFSVGVSLLLLIMKTSYADTQVSDKDSLRQYLQTVSSNKTTRYLSAFPDLNSDGLPEAIVYLLGNEWCGSGGCTTLVLSRDGSTWQIVSTITLTSRPIRILQGITNGWHNIGVLVQGGGVQKSYEAELSFDGKSYQKNPSIQPAKSIEENSLGTNVIKSTMESQLIW